MEKYLIDSHAHFGMLTHDSLENILKRAMESRVQKFITVSTNEKDLKQNQDLALANESLFYSLGLHPHEAKDSASALALLESFFSSGIPPKCVGIGEIGLDYYYENSPKAEQIPCFEQQVHLAKKWGLPLIIHCRDAYPDFFEALQRTGLPPTPGVLHCFTGTYEEAKKGVDLGFKVSFSGIVTFRKAKELQETCKKLPLDVLLIETDCPFLAPEPYRGKTNEPAYLLQTAIFISQLKQVPLDEIIEATQRNTASVFKI